MSQIKRQMPGEQEKLILKWFLKRNGAWCGRERWAWSFQVAGISRGTSHLLLGKQGARRWKQPLLSWHNKFLYTKISYFYEVRWNILYCLTELLDVHLALVAPMAACALQQWIGRERAVKCQGLFSKAPGTYFMNMEYAHPRSRWSFGCLG